MRRLANIARTSAFGDLFHYSTASLFNAFANLGASFIAFSLIPPGEIGIWQSLFLLNNYMIILQLGIATGLARELPYELGRGDQECAKRLATTSLFHALLLVSFFVIATVVMLYVYREQGPKYLFGGAAVGGVLALRPYQEWMGATFRSTSAFRRLARVYWIGSIFSLASIYLVYQYGYYGLVARVFLLAFLATLLTHLWRPIRVRPRFHKPEFSRLFKTGMPIYGLSYLRDIATTVPRLILLSLGGVGFVGLYAPANTGSRIMQMFHPAVGKYAVAKLSFRYGKDKDPKYLWRIYRMLVPGMILAMAPIVVAGWFLIPPVFNRFFTDYVESIEVTRLTLVAGGISVGMLSLGGMVAMRKIKDLARYSMAYVLIGASMPLLFVQFMEPFRGIGFALVVAAVIQVALSMFMLRRSVFSDDGKAS